MPSIRPTKKPTLRSQNVAIIPGGWGGRIHFNELVKRLAALKIPARVVLRNDKTKPATLVVTHSVGCLENWERMGAQKLVFVAPVLLDASSVKPQYIRKKVFVARARELEYQGKHGLVLKGTLLFGKAMVKSLQDPILMSHQFKLLLKNNFIKRLTTYIQQNPSTEVLVIQYRGDVWVESSLKRALKEYPNVRIRIQDDSHDDILYRPTYYASLIERVLV